MSGWRILLTRRWLGYLALAIAFAIACAFLSSWEGIEHKVKESLIDNNLNGALRDADGALAFYREESAGWQ